MSIEAMKQALAKFEHLWEIGIDAEYKVELLPEIEALRQAIEQAEYDNLTVKFGERAKEYLEGAKKSWQEPVAWVDKVWVERLDISKQLRMELLFSRCQLNNNQIPLYTAPPKREIEQEPVAWDGECVLGHCGSPDGCDRSGCCRADLAPPKREWVGLTEYEVHKIIDDCTPDEAEIEELIDFSIAILAVEAKLKEKNT